MAYVSKFNADDRKLLSVKDRVAIATGKLSEEEISSLISSRIQGGIPQETKVDMALEEAFPTPPEEQVASALVPEPAPREDFSDVPYTPYLRGAVGRTARSTEGLASTVQGASALLGSWTGLESDPAMAASLEETRLSNKAEADKIDRYNQEANATIENPALRWLDRRNNEAAAFLPQVAPMLWKPAAALPIAIAGTDKYNEVVATGASKTEAAGAAALSMSIEAVTELFGKRGGRAFKKAMTEGASEVVATGGGMIADKVQSVTTTPEMNQNLPETVGEVADALSGSFVLGSSLGGGIGKVQDVIGDRAAAKAAATEADRIARREAAVFAPVSPTGLDPDLDKGIAAGNAMVAALKDTPVSQGDSAAATSAKTFEQMFEGAKAEANTEGLKNLQLRNPKEQLGLPLGEPQPLQNTLVLPQEAETPDLFGQPPQTPPQTQQEALQQAPTPAVVPEVAPVETSPVAPPPAPPFGEPSTPERREYLAWEKDNTVREKTAKLASFAGRKDEDISWNREWEGDTRVRSVKEAEQEIRYFEKRAEESRARVELDKAEKVRTAAALNTDSQADLFDDPTLQQEPNVTRDMFSGELSQRESPPTEGLRQAARIMQREGDFDEVDPNTPLPQDPVGRPLAEVTPFKDVTPVAMGQQNWTGTPLKAGEGTPLTYARSKVTEAVAAARAEASAPPAATGPAPRLGPNGRRMVPKGTNAKKVEDGIRAMMDVDGPESPISQFELPPPTQAEAPSQDVEINEMAPLPKPVNGMRYSTKEVEDIIASDTSEFGDVVRAGIKKGKVTILTHAEAKATRPQIGDATAGWYEPGTGRMYLISDRTDNRFDPVAVIAHELTHAGLQQLKGAKYPIYVAAIRRMAKEGNTTAKEALRGADEQMRNMRDGAGRAAPIDANQIAQQLPGEIVAYAVHTTQMAKRDGRTPGRMGALVKNIMSDVRATLAETGYKSLDFLTPDDIVRLSSKAAWDVINSQPGTTLAKAPKTKPKLDLPEDKEGLAADGTYAGKGRRPSKGKLTLPENKNLTERQKGELSNVKLQNVFHKMLFGNTSGEMRGLNERAIGLKTEATHKIISMQDRLKEKLGVTPEMVKGYMTGTDLQRSAALKNIANLPRGKEALVLIKSIKEDMRQMSFDAITKEAGVKWNEDGSFDIDHLTPETKKFLLASLKNLDTYQHRAYEVFFDAKTKKDWQNYTWGDFTKGRDSEGSRRVEHFIVKTVANDLMLPVDPKAQTKELVANMYENWGKDSRGKTHAEMVKYLEDLRNTKSIQDFRDKAEMIAKDILGLAVDINSKAASRYRGAAMDRSTLKKKTQLPPYVRELMGEVEDPWFNMVNTYVKLADLSVSQQHIEKLKSLGEKYGVLVPSDGNTNTDLDVKISGDQYGRLNGMSTTPHFAELIKASVSSEATFGKFRDDLSRGAHKKVSEAIYSALASGAISTGRALKSAIILGSATTWIYNFVSSPAFMVQSGNWNPKHAVQGMKAAGELVAAHNRGRISSDKFRELLRGMVVDGIQTGDIRENEIKLLEKLARDSLRTNQSKAGKYYRKGKDLGGEVLGITRDAYAVMDLWSKFANYYAEKDYLRAYHKERGNNITEDQLEAEAADRTNMTNPTYSRASPIVRTLDTMGLTPFMTFVAEIPRTTYNSMSLGLRDLYEGTKEGSKARTINGAKRVAGTLASTAYHTKMLGFVASMGYGALDAMVGDDEAEDMDEVFKKALDSLFSLWGPTDSPENRELQAGLGPFYDGADLLRVGDDNGKPQFVSISRGDPRNTFVEAVVASMREEGDTEAKMDKFTETVVGGMSKLAERYIFKGFITDTDPKIKRKAPDIYESLKAKVSNATGGRIGEEGLDRILNIIQPYSVVTNAVVAASNYLDAPEQLGKDEKMDGDFWSAVMGGPVMEFDPVAATSTFAPWALGEADDKVTALIKEAGAKGVDDETMDELAIKAVAAQYQGFQKARRIVIAADAAGMSVEDITKNLKTANVPKDDINNLIKGTFVPKDISNSKKLLSTPPTSDVSDEEQKVREEDRKARLARVAASLKAAASDPKYTKE